MWFFGYLQLIVITSKAIVKKKSSYSQDNLTEALSAIRNKTMTYKEAETKFGIPKSTLNCLVYRLVLFSLLPHTSHILQPLDKVFLDRLSQNGKSRVLRFCHNIKHQ